MSASSKSVAMKLVLAHEGGYVNNPKDPGGETNKGVTKAVYDAYRLRKGLPKRSVKMITDAELNSIYTDGYWDKVDADALPAGIDYMVYDFAVNSGPSRAVKALQRLVGAGVDGIIGDDTITKTCAMAADDEEKLIREYCEARLAWMKTLKTWKTFGTGWQRRVMGAKLGVQTTDSGVIDYATKMAREDAQFGKVRAIAKKDLPAAIGSKAGEVAGGNANESDAAVSKSKIGVGAIVSGGGTALVAAKPVVDSMIEALEPARETSQWISHVLIILATIAALLGVGYVLLSQKEKFDERASA